MDKSDFVPGMMTLFNYFTKFEPVIPADGDNTPGTIEIYYVGLADINQELWQAVVLKALTEFKVEFGVFFPEIATLRQYAADIVLPARRSAMEAWGELTKAMTTIGSTIYRGGDRPHFSDPALEQFIERYGWNHLCLNDDPEGVIRAHFKESYLSIQKSFYADAQELPALTAARNDLQAKAIAGTIGDVTKRLTSGRQT